MGIRRHLQSFVFVKLQLKNLRHVFERAENTRCLLPFTVGLRPLHL